MYLLIFYFNACKLSFLTLYDCSLLDTVELYTAIYGNKQFHKSTVGKLQYFLNKRLNH